VTSATSRESRVLLVTVNTLSSIPDLLTIDDFEKFLVVLPDNRGTGTFALDAIVLPPLCLWVRVCSLIIAVADHHGSLKATTEQGLCVFAQVILVVISCQSTHPPLLICVHLSTHFLRVGHRSSAALWSLNGYKEEADGGHS
jgi:hypothetical protein